MIFFPCPNCMKQFYFSISSFSFSGRKSFNSSFPSTPTFMMMIIPPIHLSQFLFECVSLNQNTVALIRSFEFGFYQFVHLYFIMVWKFVYFFQIAEYITS
mmetsp:Transcript_25968/g.24822  ORF Transcript_25968/g.24822 Transcript_25968/m.24822 type:complete len:100 (-) Transcript_25968:284-583(-)